LLCANLFYKVKRGGSLILMYLGLGKPFASLNQFAFIGDNHALQLLPLAKHLLPTCLDFFLQMKVLLQKRIPFALAKPFASFVLLQHLL